VKLTDGKIILRLTLDEIRAVAERLDLPPALDVQCSSYLAMRSAYMEIWRVYRTNRKDMP
jgi:hypothetical protein